jgi:glucose-1-phosphate adenylyltransferase
MELLQSPHATIFCNPHWPVFTRHEPLPAARVLHDAFVSASLLSPGAVVAGQAIHSVVSARCRIGAGAVVKDSVLLPGAVIGEGCCLERVVVDADYEIAPNSQLGPGSFAPDGAPFYTSPGGIVLASSRAVTLPPSANVRLIA